MAFRRQAGACAAGGQLGRIFGLVEKCEIVGGRAIKRGNAGDSTIEIGAGLRLGAREGGDLTHGKPPPPTEEKGLGHVMNRGPRRPDQNFVPPPKRNCCT